MKKIALLLVVCFMVSFLGCVSDPAFRNQGVAAKSTMKYALQFRAVHNRCIRDIRYRTEARGYLSIEDLELALNSTCADETIEEYISKHGGKKTYRKSLLGEMVKTTDGRFITIPHCNGVNQVLFLADAIENDWLPFKAMFYLSLENENYEKAELIRRSWASNLKKIITRIDKALNPRRGFHSNWGEIATGLTSQDCDSAKQKASYRIEKLTSVVGLTDSMLVKLRKELAIALKENDWDDAQKIQNIIASRVKELRPPVTQQIVVGQSGSSTIVQQPSTQHIKVERIPRYGAEDVGRAVSLLQGRSGRLTSKQAGALKFFDILMKR